LILMMFIGQLGVTATLLSWTKKSPKGNHVSYPIEEVKVG
jgi:Trk-type K+ transport system membrane component